MKAGSKRRMATVVFIFAFCLLFGGSGAKRAEAAEFTTPSKIQGDEFIAYVDECMERALQEKTMAGAAVAITKGDRIVFQKGYGYADLEKKEEVHPDTTVFEYGSVSKLFTWVSLMQLYEEEKLDLFKDVKEYLPADFKVPRTFDEPIRVIDLMNHQAGFDDYIIGLFSKKKELPSLREALEEHKVLQVEKPGTMISYSNYGAALAGYIVENVSGQSFEEYVKEHLFLPCGMEHTTMTPVFSSDPWTAEHKSGGYAKEGEVLEKQDEVYVPIYPAGSANGSVTELARFGIALCREKNMPVIFPNQKGIEDLFSTSYTANEKVCGVSHGFFQFEGEKNTYWHNGSTENFCSFFACVPEEGFSISLLCNTEIDIDVIQEIGFSSVAKSEESLKNCEQELRNEKTGFPSSKEVEGTYADYRQVHHGIAQLYYLLPGMNVRVKSIGENRIEMQGETFTQVAPYLYLNDQNGVHAYFTVKDGKVIKCSYLIEFAPVAFPVKANQLLFYIAFFFFVIMSLIILTASFVFWIRRSMKKENGKVLCGMFFADLSLGFSAVLAWNFSRIVRRILERENFKEISGNIIGNGVIGVAMLASSLAALVFIKRQQGKASRVLVVLYSVSVLLMLAVLLVNGMFSLVG